MKLGRGKLSWEDLGSHVASSRDMHVHACTHTHTLTRMHKRAHRGNVLFLCCRPVALDEIRDAGSQGMEHAGIRACVTRVRKHEFLVMNLTVETCSTTS